MDTLYNDHRIIVNRGDVTKGWDSVNFKVVRESDGFVCLEDSETSAVAVETKTIELQKRIDKELKSKDPWGEAAEKKQAEEIEPSVTDGASERNNRL